MRFDLRLAVIAVISVTAGLTACEEQHSAHVPASAEITHSDTVVLARAFAQALARADTAVPQVRDKLRSYAAELRVAAQQGAWETAVHRELRAVRPRLFEPLMARATVWLSIQPLKVEGDTAEAWAGWHGCPGDGNAFSQRYRFIRDGAAGRWKSIPPELDAIGNVFCGVSEPAVSPETGEPASKPPAA
jgi:hypothetical protein